MEDIFVCTIPYMNLNVDIKKRLCYSVVSIRYLDDLIASFARKMRTDCAKDLARKIVQNICTCKLAVQGHSRQLRSGELRAAVVITTVG